MNGRPIQLKIVGKIELPVDKRGERTKVKRRLERLVNAGAVRYYDVNDDPKDVQSIRMLRNALYKAQGGKCCYCGIQTELPLQGNQGVIEDHTATLEHVYSRKDIRRLICKEVKLACYKCNHEKGREDYIHAIEGYDWQESYTWSLIDNAQLDRTWWQRVKYWWNKLKCNIWKTRK